MARKCKIEKDKLRSKMSQAASATREALKLVIKKSTDYDETISSVIKLNKSKRDASPVRCRNRCRICGRSRVVRFAGRGRRAPRCPGLRRKRARATVKNRRSSAPNACSTALDPYPRYVE